MRSLLPLIILTFSISFSFGLQAAEKSSLKLSKKEQEAEKSEKELEKKKLGVDQSDFMPESNSFGLIFSYRTSYDQMEQVQRKSYNHFLGMAGTYSFDKHWSTYMASGLSYETFGNNVYRETEDDYYYNMSDISFGLIYSKMKPLSFVRRSSNTLDITLPTSERAQIDEHRLYLSLTNFMTSYTWKKLSLFNRINANYIWNKFRYSFFNNDLIARDWALSNSLGVNFQPLPRLGIRASFRTDMTRHLDERWVNSFGNSFSIFTFIWGAQVYATLVNSSYPENDQILVPYQDQFQQRIAAGVTYVF